MAVERNDMLVKLKALETGLNLREVRSSRDIQMQEAQVRVIERCITLVETDEVRNYKQLQAVARHWMAAAHRKQQEAARRRFSGKVAYYGGAYSASMTVLTLR